MPIDVDSKQIVDQTKMAPRKQGISHRDGPGSEHIGSLEIKNLPVEEPRAGKTLEPLVPTDLSPWDRGRRQARGFLAFVVDIRYCLP